MKEFIIFSIIFLISMSIIIGPSRMSRYFAGYKADAYGANWLVVKEDMSGNTIRYWELTNKSIGNERDSDGIYFIDETDNVVHLSGFYTYVQVKGTFEEAKKCYLKIGQVEKNKQ